MERRRFVRLAAAATVVTAGCLDDEPEEELPEAAEFGYENWLPSRRLLTRRIRRPRDVCVTAEALSRDDETRTLVGDAGVSYGDVDAYLSADGSPSFVAFSGSFDEDLADALAEELDGSETTDDRGFTVVTGTVEGVGFEVAVSEDAVVASGEGDATRVLDTAFGETTRQSENDEFVAELSEYAEDPFAVVFNYGPGTMYQFADSREDGPLFVEVSDFLDEDEAEEYEYPGEEYDDVNVERDGTIVVIETDDTMGGIESLFLGDGGLVP